MRLFFPNKQKYYWMLMLCLFASCIQEDIVDDGIAETLSITTPIESLEVGTSYQLEATYRNTIGDEESAELSWVSEDESVMTISSTGIVTAVSLGEVDITVSLKGRFDLSDVIRITTGASTVVTEVVERSGSLMTTSSYPLSGDFTLVETDSGLELRMASNFTTSSALPGLYVYLTNNVTTNNGALEVSSVTTFSGEMTFTIPGNVSINEYDYVLFYCKPFSADVGNGQFID